MPGIVTGIILTSGRIFGEAAALLFTAGVSTPQHYDFSNFNLTDPSSPWSPFHPATTLVGLHLEAQLRGPRRVRRAGRGRGLRGADHRRPHLQPGRARAQHRAVAACYRQSLVSSGEEKMSIAEAPRPEPVAPIRVAVDTSRAVEEAADAPVKLAVRDLSVY